MIMSYRHRDDVIGGAHYSNKTSAKSIDKICAKLHLHIDPEKHNTESEVETIKNAAAATVVDLGIDYIKDKERINNILSSSGVVIDHHHNNNNNNNNKNNNEAEYGTDVDMYSSDSPKSSYNPCPSPTIIHDHNPSMSYTTKESSSPPLLTSIHDENNANYNNEHSRHSSSVIVCTHDNSSMYDNVCPVSPVFVSTHDDMNISYDNIHPSSPVIDHMLGKNSVSYTSIRSNSPVVSISEEKNPYTENNAASNTSVDGEQETNSGVSMNDTAGSPNSPNVEKSDTEKAETKSNKLKPRHTTQYNNWHHNDMIMAIKAVQMKYLSMTAAAKRYGIPRTTLRHYLHDGTNRETKRACFSLPKKSEDDLVEFALENCHVNEKALYKLIFDKAKEFSQEYILESGEEGRRVVPTPAWIRRFVYRHKQLHSIFPTFLAKWEHPVLGDRKIPSDPEDFTKCNGSHENSKIGKDKTEIIFPQGKYDSFYPPRMYDINGNKNSDSMSERNSMSEKKQLQARVDNHISQSKSLLSRSGNEVVESFLDSDSQRNSVKAEQYFSDDERIIPYKDLLSRISKPPFTSSKITSSHNSQLLDLKYGSHRHERNNSESSQNHSINDSQQYVNLSSIPIIRSSQYSSKTESTPTSVSEMHIDNELGDDTNKSDVSYSDKLRSLVKPLSSSDDRERDAVQFSEFDVMKITLNAMEESLGVDYVQLFTERYCRNKSLERLYGKWVSLRSEIDLTD